VIVTALAVLAAALFVVWTVLLPRPLRIRLRQAIRGRRAQPTGGTGACGSGGCANCSD
jgi:hypothetical protein